MAAVRLRVKDVEFARREIIVREGKGNKGRITVLPENLIAPCRRSCKKREPCMKRMWRRACRACICRMRWR